MLHNNLYVFDYVFRLSAAGFVHRQMVGRLLNT